GKPPDDYPVRLLQANQAGDRRSGNQTGMSNLCQGLPPWSEAPSRVMVVDKENSLSGRTVRRLRTPNCPNNPGRYSFPSVGIRARNRRVGQNTSTGPARRTGGRRALRAGQAGVTPTTPSGPARPDPG